MNTQLVKNENQILLFDLIQKELPANLILVDVISDLLNVSTDSAYRRIRGIKLIDFEEAVMLCNHFKVPLDSFVNVNDYKKQILCGYAPLDFRDLDNHLLYLQNLLDDIDEVRLTAPDGEMILSASTLPTFTYLPYNELTFFILFSWSNSVYGYTNIYEEFVKGLDVNTLLSYHERIVKSYQQVPSSEIWTEGSFDRVLTLLNHHYEVEHFTDKNLPLLICEQLLDLINTLQNWAEKAEKGPNGTPYRFYLSEIEFDNSIILYKKENTSKCFLKLFNVNGLRTSNERFCREIEYWLENTEHRAVLLSGASERERYKYFSGLKQKVRFLIDKIYQSNLKEWSKVNKNVKF